MPPHPSIRAGLLLSRPPVVTRTLPPFESALYAYNQELEARLAWTFPRLFYFKKGTLAEHAFLKMQPGVVAPQPGVYFPQGNPEIKHGRDRRQPETVVLRKDDSANAEDIFTGDAVEPVKPQPRVTEADKTNDTTSLERALEHTLYLLTKTDLWRFPAFAVPEYTPLHIAATQGLHELGGNNMRVSTVLNTPAQVVRYQDGRVVPTGVPADAAAPRDYLIRAHIHAGQFVGTGSHGWFTKAEVREKVGEEYFLEVEFLLV